MIQLFEGLRLTKKEFDFFCIVTFAFNNLDCYIYFGIFVLAEHHNTLASLPNLIENAIFLKYDVLVEFLTVEGGP